MKLRNLLIILLVGICFAGCDNNDTPDVVEANKPPLNILLTTSETSAIVNTNDFGLRLFNSINSSVGEQNIFFHPL